MSEEMTTTTEASDVSATSTGSDTAQSNASPEGGSNPGRDAAPKADETKAESTQAEAGKTDSKVAGETGKSLLDTDDKVDPSDQPLKEWKDDSIVIPDGYEVSKDALSSFGETAVKAGLTQKQAEALVKWQLEEVKAQQQALYDLGKEELQKEWGRKFDSNKKAVVGLISRIDKALGDESFSKSLNASGAALHPGVIRGLYKLSELIAEDSMGKGASVAPEQTETALEGLENALREQLKRKKNV